MKAAVLIERPALEFMKSNAKLKIYKLSILYNQETHEPKRRKLTSCSVRCFFKGLALPQNLYSQSKYLYRQLLRIAASELRFCIKIIIKWLLKASTCARQPIQSFSHINQTMVVVQFKIDSPQFFFMKKPSSPDVSVNNSIQNTIYSINSAATILEEDKCRICYEKNSSSSLLSPCSCRGSVEFVHQDCINLWIRAIIKNNEVKLPEVLARQKIKCELCQSQISVEIQTHWRRKSAQEFREQNIVFFTILCFLLLVEFGLVAYFSIFLKKTISSHKQSLSTPITFGILLFFCVVLLGVNIWYLLTKFILHHCVDIKVKTDSCRRQKDQDPTDLRNKKTRFSREYKIYDLQN